MNQPYTFARVITPSDASDLQNQAGNPIKSRGVLMLASGNLAIIDEAGNTVVLTGLAAGVIHPIKTRRILSTGTAATTITVFW